MRFARVGAPLLQASALASGRSCCGRQELAKMCASRSSRQSGSPAAVGQRTVRSTQTQTQARTLRQSRATPRRAGHLQLLAASSAKPSLLAHTHTRRNPLSGRSARSSLHCRARSVQIRAASDSAAPRAPRHQTAAATPRPLRARQVPPQPTRSQRGRAKFAAPRRGPLAPSPLCALPHCSRSSSD